MSTIDEIKQKLDIVDFIGEYIKLQKSGRNYRALCPFHSEKTPSFFVFPDQQSWHCFGACGTGGDIFSFVMKKEGIDFGQALRFLAEKSGVNLSNPELQDKEEDKKRDRLIQVNEAAAVYYHHLLQNTPVGKKARTYLAKREISSQTINDFQLGFSPDSFDDTKQYLLSKGLELADLLNVGLIIEKEDGGTYDRFRNRLMFPIRDIKGHVIAFGARALDDSLPKYLNSPQTLLFDKSKNLYGIDRAKESIRKHNLAIIMEGYMDVLTAHQHGWDNAVASMGTALTEKQLSSLKKLTKNLILALDADTAGEEATLRIVETIDIENYLHTEVKVIVPTQGKDPDEQIRNDPSIWEQLLKEAKPIVDYVLDTVRDKINLDNAQDKALTADKILPIISKIDDPIRRGHYIQKFAQILNAKENDLRDRLTKFKIDERKQRTRKIGSPTPIKEISSSSNSTEGYCLWLLLQHPELKSEAIKLKESYFEFNENREIYSKWLQSNDIDYLKSSLDSALHSYLDKLLTKVFPTMSNEDNDTLRQTLNTCITILQERSLKRLEAKKAKLLDTEAEVGGREAQLAKVNELGVEEHKQLKRVFEEQRRRRSLV